MSNAIPQNANVYTEVSSLKALKGQVKSGDQDAIEKVAKQFEAIFLQMMLSGMRKTIQVDDEYSNDKSMYYDLFDKQVAMNLSEKGGIGPVKYAMVADIKREIQKAYGIEHPDAGVALRGSFLIDKEGVVRHQVVNDLPLGRNIDEMLRMVDALQFHEEHGEVCPAQWEKGKKGMGASPDGVAKYLTENASNL